MENNEKKIKWCMKIKGGIKRVEPNETLSSSYLEKAKSSLMRAEKNFQDNDLLWTTIVIYYAEYYALYAFLQKIGIKSENHSCFIATATFLLDKEKVDTINQHKEKRIDAQYYMKTGKEKDIQYMLLEAKEFVSSFDELISNLNNNKIKEFRKKLTSIIK